MVRADHELLLRAGLQAGEAKSPRRRRIKSLRLHGFFGLRQRPVYVIAEHVMRFHFCYSSKALQ